MSSMPPTKKRLIGASDRITLDVGGTKFVAAASTLTASSSYFASLLSENWNESNNDGPETEIFLDQDPVPFGKLLSYMRRGMIKVEDIDTDVLALAEFLGIERLLLAAKIRWYYNIGAGSFHTEREAEEIAAAFDQEHGGILKAISSGLFPSFLKKDTTIEKDFAMMKVQTRLNQRDNDDFSNYRVNVYEVGKGTLGPAIMCGGMIGALNGLFANGYTWQDKKEQIDHEYPLHYHDSFTFSRARHSAIYNGSATDVFIPTEDEIEQKKESNRIKQFVLSTKDISGQGEEIIIAPAEFGDGVDPYAEATIENGEFWLERNNFVTHERRIEERGFFSWYMKSLVRDTNATCTIHSRHTSRVQQGSE